VLEVQFAQVQTQEQKDEAGSLIREYLDLLGERLARDYGMSLDSEAMVLSDLMDPQFHPPTGRFYLARYQARTAGVGCLKMLDTNVGELQRMYVVPAFRGKGIGRSIANRLIDDARRIGYRRLRLESLEFLEAAHALYRSLGFRQIAPYEHNSMGAYQSQQQLQNYYRVTVFMEMEL
jgi:GNAT superfamily N-acetyltransferase